jgi:ABC-type branched-subunit amino acid transport system ATPase component
MGRMLVAEGLTKGWGGPPVVDGVSFTLARGSITGLIGPNGAGWTARGSTGCGPTRCSPAASRGRSRSRAPSPP